MIKQQARTEQEVKTLAQSLMACTGAVVVTVTDGPHTKTVRELDKQWQRAEAALADRQPGE